jgi:Domain of unknown function (DUF4142)
VRRLMTILLVAGVLAGGFAVWQTWRTTPTSGAPNQSGWVSTQWGPLGPADRNMIIQVRLAGLWEMPVGQEMAERATQKRTREVGTLLAKEHMELDQLDREAAAKLGVLLPNQPAPDKVAWLRQITEASGASYDWMAVNLLRQAHGGVLPVLIAVRVGTRNDVVRTLADQAIDYVRRHIDYLESTGLVDFARLSEPPDPPHAVVTREGQYENIPVALLAIGALTLLAGLAVLVANTLLVRRQSEPSRRRRRTRSPPSGGSSS